MTYSLSTSLSLVKGIGPKLVQQFAARGLVTVQDLLLFVPLRYEDRSKRTTLAEIPLNELVTVKAEVVTTNNYYKGRRSIQSATLKDESGRIKAMWFNNRFIMDKLQRGHTYLFSGKRNDRGMLVQPTVEDDKLETIHTGRLVPIYSEIPGIKQGTLRRILKHILSELGNIPQDFGLEIGVLPLGETLAQLHFPDEAERVIKARERLALEELLGLMQTSQQIKEEWLKNKSAIVFDTQTKDTLLDNLPFALTQGQTTAIAEIVTDMQRVVPMNRLLIGDVGSGKTVVAGYAATRVVEQGHSAAVIAPTRILAQQHLERLQTLFPTIPVKLMAGTTREKINTEPTLWVGTHALINKLLAIEPALIVYDEQHRFGVAQRTIEYEKMPHHPHILTMSATPIPRTLMLTIFSHLDLSLIDELPAGRLPIKTWLIPESKRADSYTWMQKHIATERSQVLIVCPFIDPSDSAALENVAAVSDMYDKVKKSFTGKNKPVVELLHGRLTKKEQAEITDRLYNREIDVLVTTPIVEVGVDLPAASIMVIEAAERFGLASLHQLRGRVGRAGQQAYCLLFTTSRQAATRERLQKFTEVTNGRELAELDLQYRGAGNIFGTEQHGFDQLQFADWANLELIALARGLFERVSSDPSWKPLFSNKTSKNTPSAN